MNNRIKLSQDRRKEMIGLIKKYFINERDEELGDLAASLILDFFIEELAPEFYNQGVYDSYQYMSGQIEDLLGIQIYKRKS
ncbi:DUF2164 domain-containing protein [Caloranaerobacter ferrireducens]|uniref:DUF2164 domain-containing protein n=1 Tax=Caloranaerobacter ferrireducens TaxID=1323370 RepID=UPI000A5256A8|nr:DUF2164 domain-containing protein [Caloranaerobacter ferrireducens]